MGLTSMVHSEIDWHVRGLIMVSLCQELMPGLRSSFDKAKSISPFALKKGCQNRTGRLKGVVELSAHQTGLGELW